MPALVEQLLASARILEPGFRLEPVELDLCQLVEGVIAAFRRTGKTAGSPSARVGASELRGSWDREWLEHVVRQLLRNAIRFGEGKPITVRCDDLGTRAALAVSDHGIGIAPEDQGRVFERFSRAVSAQHYGGLGLGLWMTREIVARMGGTIGVKSAVGEGATFTVELPRRTERG